jgi:TorA maturation chaperone TorD
MSGARSARGSADSQATAAGEAALRHALFARLLSSPHDWDIAFLDETRELAAATLRAADAPALAFQLRGLHEALLAFGDDAVDELRPSHAALFGAGSSGPSLPIREELTASANGGAKTEVLRYYDLFGYEVEERYASAPDHVAVLVEFLAWLAGNESAARDADDLRSLRLAQREFASQHLAHWLPALALAVRSRDRGFYARVFTCLEASLAVERARLEILTGH